MKDVLLKIMIEEGLINDERKDHPSVVYSISEITDIVKKFIEWLTLDDNDFYPQISDDNKPCYWDDKNEREVDINRVFNFWYNEIRNKN